LVSYFLGVFFFTIYFELPPLLIKGAICRSHTHFIPEGVAGASQIFLRNAHVLPKLTMRNTADVTGGKPIAVLLQSISGVSDINPLVAFYDIHGGKGEVLFFYFVPDITRDVDM
jgi:hypothetical protein